MFRTGVVNEISFGRADSASTTNLNPYGRPWIRDSWSGMVSWPYLFAYHVSPKETFMPKQRGGLGRGLSALIPPGPAPTEEARQEEPATEQQQFAPGGAPLAPAQGNLNAPVASISPNPRQPRQTMQPEQLEELAVSIREHGLLQPLIVARAEQPGKYNLIAGERRWRAAILAGLETVPVIVKEASPRGMLELALVENLQRADLNPLEEALAYRSLVDDFGLKQEEVAARVGKSRSAVVNSLRLLRLPAAAQESLALGLILEGHARAILQVPDQEQQLRLLERTVSDGLSVRQVESLARRLAEQAAQPGEQNKEEPRQTPLYNPMRDLEDRFRNALGTKVQLSRSSRGGKLTIYFYSDEELDRIYGTIVGEEE